MAGVKNISVEPVPLADGRLLSAGDKAYRVDLNDPHNRAQLDAGALLELTRPKRPSRSSKTSTEGTTTP